MKAIHLTLEAVRPAAVPAPLAILKPFLRLLVLMAFGISALCLMQGQAGADCIVCPANINVPTDPGYCTAVVNFAPTLTGNCTAGSCDCTPPSGFPFPIGTTQVTCTGYDTNSQPVGSCFFSVTVVDAEPPIITCPPDITVNQAASGGTPVTFAPNATDSGCQVPSVSCSPPSGSTFPVGTTLVTCTATDTSGNTNGCNFNITVLAQPRQIKIQVRDALVAKRNSTTADQSKFNAAINYLNKSVDPKYWWDDRHPKPGSAGESVFNNEKSAVSQLLSIQSKYPPTIRDMISNLVAADRSIAQIAIDEAIARNGNAGKIRTARGYLSKGDSDAAANKPTNAIDDYKNAWKYAIGA